MARKWSDVIDYKALYKAYAEDPEVRRILDKANVHSPTFKKKRI